MLKVRSTLGRLVLAGAAVRSVFSALPRLAAALALAAALTFTSTAARAVNIISFVPIGDGSVQTDVPVAFDVLFNFDVATLGGGFDLLFPDTAFSFKSFVFSPSLGDYAGFQLKPLDNQSAPLFTIAFGNFNGLVGAKTIGTLTLLGKQNFALTSDPTGEQVLGGMDNNLPAGPFISAADLIPGNGGTPLLVEYRGLFRVVPEPSTGLLVLAGLLGLAARRRWCA